MSQKQDNEIEEPIPLNYGEGKEITYSKCKWLTVLHSKERNQVELKLSSWVGISLDAQHTYGKFKLPYMGFQCITIPKGEDRFKVGQNLGGSIGSSIDYVNEIELTRPVTRKDLKMDGGETFRGYSIGDFTDRFDTEADLLARAKKEFMRIFGRGWTLYIEKQRPTKEITHRGEVVWENYKEVIVGPEDTPKPKPAPRVKKDKKQMSLGL